MRIVVDLQGAQASNRHRGIGRYSLQLVQALVRNRGEHEILVTLNATFVDSIESIRAALDGVLRQDQILVWEVPGPVAAVDESNTQRRLSAELIREAYLASLRPDWILVASLFEGLGDDVVTSIGRHANIPTAVVLYDLIPLIHRDPYLCSPVVERWYLQKIDHLRRANLLLSISDSSGREAVEHLGFSSSAVVPIGTDCDARFQPLSLSTVQREHLNAAYGITRPFVMYTGGVHSRGTPIPKNRMPP